RVTGTTRERNCPVYGLVPAARRGPGRRRVRSARGARDHEPAAPTHRVPGVASRALDGVRVLALCDVARSRGGHRHADCVGPRGGGAGGRRPGVAGAGRAPPRGRPRPRARAIGESPPMTPLLEVPTDLLRLLPQPPATSLVDHLARFGPLPAHRGELIGEAARAGLRGRGGANFPTATKLTAVRHAADASRRRGVVVANGTESEPVSDKDKTLLVFAPHLVLDGIVAAALAVGADEGVVCVDRAATPALHAIERACKERDDPINLRVAATPDRYV